MLLNRQYHGALSSLKDTKIRGCFIFATKLQLCDCIGKEIKEQNAKWVSLIIKSVFQLVNKVEREAKA